MYHVLAYKHVLGVVNPSTGKDLVALPAHSVPHSNIDYRNNDDAPERNSGTSEPLWHWASQDSVLLVRSTSTQIAPLPSYRIVLCAIRAGICP